MKAHNCVSCGAKAGHLLRRLQWTEANDAIFKAADVQFPEREIVLAWERREVPKVFR